MEEEEVLQQRENFTTALDNFITYKSTLTISWCIAADRIEKLTPKTADSITDFLKDKTHSCYFMYTALLHKS